MAIPPCLVASYPCPAFAQCLCLRQGLTATTFLVLL